MSNSTYIEDDDERYIPSHKRETKKAGKPKKPQTMEIPFDLYDRLLKLGIIPNEVRDMNVGASDYSKHIIQPWAIWQEYELNPWDADIIKRVLRHKATDTRKMDYEKIIHICQERIRQIETDIHANK
jgi:hypothetical protein